ncbi:hypothetical protein CBNA_0259 [Coxiella burnetii str. Namibia]|nr:hypothetical protein CBNA_0259 [Coxiella burnetii str. Namibia]
MVMIGSWVIVPEVIEIVYICEVIILFNADPRKIVEDFARTCSENAHIMFIN